MKQAITKEDQKQMADILEYEQYSEIWDEQNSCTPFATKQLSFIEMFGYQIIVKDPLFKHT